MFTYCRSIDLTAPEFEAALAYLKTRDMVADADELLWKTRHKKVIRIGVPAEFAPGEQPDYQVVWKHYGEKRFFRYLFRPSLALREWKGFKLAQKCGIPTAKVLAAGEERSFVLLRSSYFMTEMVKCSGDGDDFLAGNCRENDTVLAQEFAEKNLRLLARLHRNLLVHGGFTPRNELYTLTGKTTPGEQLDVIWIDLATCRKVPFWKRKKLQQKDLNYFLKPWNADAETKRKLLEIYQQELHRNDTGA